MFGRQRLMATTIVDGETVRRTLDGYVKVDLNVRRRINAKFDCFAGIENLLDARYRNINARAYNNPEELIGAPQAPRRVVVGVDVRLGR
jgi:outer membrane cobalamin receptor